MKQTTHVHNPGSAGKGQQSTAQIESPGNLENSHLIGHDQRRQVRESKKHGPKDVGFSRTAGGPAGRKGNDRGKWQGQELWLGRVRLGAGSAWTALRCHSSSAQGQGHDTVCLRKSHLVVLLGTN